MVIFRLPYDDKFYTLNLNSTDENSVEWVSFDEATRLGFSGEMQEISAETLLSQPLLSSHLEPIETAEEEESRETYLNKITQAIQFINEQQLQKLVISRKKEIRFTQISDSKSISLTQTFLNLCNSYPNAFVYLLNDKVCWMGAFSELLGKYNKQTSEFETMSLAGTIPISGTWTKKEIEEQKPVTQFIENILKQYSETLSISETYDHISGNIKHLRTDFKSFIAPKDLESLISELHPTPAVCGIPKTICKEAIRKLEKHDRKFYAGYIRVETESEILYFVNLRCGEFRPDGASLYVGGGITALSHPEKEWLETELKSEAILKNLAICEEAT
ncbi:chorismate-binding protein [Bergeyella porcorum]|uniref:chorismate-binding protein n=1 Tax=Bergeyella porcorum TaxID=1735111 RepID=UPI0035EFFFDF